MGFYNTLVSVTETDRQALYSIPIIQQALRGAVSHDQYLAFLTQAYHHVKHTVPLLMACGGRLPARLEWLRRAVAEYIEEESGHQEWILNDIEACGGDADAVRHGRPAMATEVLVAYGYHTVDRGNPVGFFGMVHVLEGTSVALATQAAQTLRQSLDLPDKAFTYLTSHGELDRDHTGFFAELMDRLDVPQDQVAVVHCARVIYRLYGDIFRELPSAAIEPLIAGDLA